MACRLYLSWGVTPITALGSSMPAERQLYPAVTGIQTAGTRQTSQGRDYQDILSRSSSTSAHPKRKLGALQETHTAFGPL